MFDELEDLPAINPQEGFDLLQELERSTPAEIRRQREDFRLTVKCRVELLPGNASEALKFHVQGVTGDISEGGCKALFSVPIRVGDVYRLEFDPKTLDLPIAFARCVRCLLLRDDAYEAGFKFFAPVTLPERVSQRGAASLK